MSPDLNPGDLRGFQITEPRGERPCPGCGAVNWGEDEWGRYCLSCGTRVKERRTR